MANKDNDIYYGVKLLYEDDTSKTYSIVKRKRINGKLECDAIIGNVNLKINSNTTMVEINSKLEDYLETIDQWRNNNQDSINKRFNEIVNNLSFK